MGQGVDFWTENRTRTWETMRVQYFSTFPLWISREIVGPFLVLYDSVFVPVYFSSFWDFATWTLKRMRVFSLRMQSQGVNILTENRPWNLKLETSFCDFCYFATRQVYLNEGNSGFLPAQIEILRFCHCKFGCLRLYVSKSDAEFVLPDLNPTRGRPVELHAQNDDPFLLVLLRVLHTSGAPQRYSLLPEHMQADRPKWWSFGCILKALCRRSLEVLDNPLLGNAWTVCKNSHLKPEIIAITHLNLDSLSSNEPWPDQSAGVCSSHSSRKVLHWCWRKRKQGEMMSSQSWTLDPRLLGSQAHWVWHCCWCKSRWGEMLLHKFWSYNLNVMVLQFPGPALWHKTRQDRDKGVSISSWVLNPKHSCMLNISALKPQGPDCLWHKAQDQTRQIEFEMAVSRSWSLNIFTETLNPKCSGSQTPKTWSIPGMKQTRNSIVVVSLWWGNSTHQDWKLAFMQSQCSANQARDFVIQWWEQTKIQTLRSLDRIFKNQRSNVEIFEIKTSPISTEIPCGTNAAMQTFCTDECSRFALIICVPWLRQILVCIRVVRAFRSTLKDKQMRERDEPP